MSFQNFISVFYYDFMRSVELKFAEHQGILHDSELRCLHGQREYDW